MTKETAQHLSQENVLKMKIQIFVPQFLMYSIATTLECSSHIFKSKNWKQKISICEKSVGGV